MVADVKNHPLQGEDAVDQPRQVADQPLGVLEKHHLLAQFVEPLHISLPLLALKEEGARAAAAMALLLRTEPVGLCYNSLLRVAQAHGGRDEAFEHCLEIERRTTDRLEHVGGRCLLLQRRLEIARARLHFVKQARVLDCDHRLIGEGLEQLHLMSGECARLPASDADHSDRGAPAHQRCDQHAAIAAQTREFPIQSRHMVRFGVGELDRFAVTDEQERGEFGQRPRE